MSKFSLNAITAPLSSKTGLTHAIMQSILNHAESTQNDRARMGINERGGHWSNELLAMVGSRDWTLRREKLTSQTLNQAKRFYEDALAWLVNDGHAKTITVSVWEEEPNVMGRTVTVTVIDGTKFKVDV